MRASMRAALSIVSLGIVSFSVACAGSTVAPQSPVAAASVAGAGAEPDPVVGAVNGVSLRRSELSKGALAELRDIENEQKQRELHTLWAGFEEAVEQRLLVDEAKRRGVSREDLEAQEIDAKIAVPSDDQLKSFYESARDQIGVPYEVAAPYLKDQLIRRQRRDVEQAFLSRLRAGVEVRYQLPVPELPRYDIELGGAPVIGAADAKVTIVEFSDFECPYCARARSMLDELKRLYPTEVRLAFRDFPLSQHERARPAAEAAQCAHEQNKFWPFHDKLFDNTQALGDADLRTYAKDSGLDLEVFEKCLASDRPKQAVEAHAKAGEKYGIEGTPAIFINGIKLVGLLPVQVMQAIIDRELGRGGNATANR